MMSKPLVRAAAAAALMSSAFVASAGSRAIYQANINDAQRWANGTMTDARGSADNNQLIGCYHNSSFAGCYVTNAAGLGRSCTTSNPALIDVIRTIGPESYIYFQWNTDGTCNYVLIENSSRFKPASATGY